MGLDMYLEKRNYIGNNYKEKEKQTKITIEGINQAKVTYIIEEAGYWRKANAIHKWFVDNIQSGNDDCKPYYVSKDELKKLLTDINKVLKNYKKAKKVLPIQKGFFFGSDEYDEYYFENLRKTKKIISEILKDKNEKTEYYYQSSW